MHSTAHAMHARTDHSEASTIQLQHHNHQSQNMHHTETMDRNTMTLLETMNPSHHIDERQQQQQMMNLIDPNQQQPLVSQHLIQPASSQQPLLHQMQPSHSSNLHDSSSEQILSETNLPEQQLGQQLIRGANAANSNNRLAAGANLLRQRTQIEGIVTEGGGPIVQWLLENYEIADGESLPRSTVYNHYLSHCRRAQIASVNAASFGKLIRSVFIGLKTRRLGTRGHSKYHYFGVRAKKHIQQELLRHQEDGQGCSNVNNDNSNQNSNESESDSTGNGLDCGRLSSASSNKRSLRDTSISAINQCSGHRQNQIYQEQTLDHSQQQQSHHDTKQHNDHLPHGDMVGDNVYYPNGCPINGYGTNGTNGIISNNTNHDSQYAKDNTLPLDPSHCDLDNLKNHLGANWTTLVDEHWPQYDDALIESQITKTGHSSQLKYTLGLFETKYKEYYKRMIETLRELKFSEVDQLWQEFWHPDELQPNDQDWTVEIDRGSTEVETVSRTEIGNSVNTMCQMSYQQQSTSSNLLTFRKLHELTSHSVIIDRINQIDYNLYQAIESFLMPDILSPMPRVLARYIRQFAKNIGLYIESALKDYDAKFLNEKCKSARAFGSALRRYTSLNHLSTASRAIWERRSSLAQMSIDLSRVDLRDIEHQVSLMSQNGFDSCQDKPFNSITDGSITIDDERLVQTSDIKPSEAMEERGPGIDDEIALTNQRYHHHSHNLCAMQPAQLIQNFLYLLEDPYPANRWPDWCKNLVDSRVCGSSIEEARNFVLKWNFYISLIMKELTLRSAPSFGSFQLIRLLFDEYIFYLVVSRLAQAQNKTPTQLLCSS